MSKKHLILVINPGSTSTKLAIYEEEKCLVEKTIAHSAEELGEYKSVKDQLGFRKNRVLKFLDEGNIDLGKLGCIVARGGLLKPVPGGTYPVNEAMYSELKNTTREHASNLGALIAWEIAGNTGLECYIVDPVVVDEMLPVAKVCGFKGIERISIFHALNQKASARRAAMRLNKEYSECNLIVAHLGGGISVAAHQGGRIIDVNNCLDGDGPFSPERAGGLPVSAVIERCFHSGLSEKEVYKGFVGNGGLVSLLGTNDARQVEKLIDSGREDALLAYEAMAYQVAKEICACGAVLKGKVDAIVVTGGIANSTKMVNWIKERVEFMAQVFVFPGEDEMEALAGGVLRVLRGEEQPQEYV